MINLEQGSPEWHAWRKGKIGASMAGAIMGINPWETPLKVWQRMHGIIPPIQKTRRMELGNILEPIARDLVNKETEFNFKPATYEHPTEKWMIASLDGISEYENIILEIKCGGKQLYEYALLGIIPPYYNCQIHHQMNVKKVNKAIYMCCEVDYNIECIANHTMFTIERDEELCKKIMEKEKEFYGWFIDFIQPPYTNNDYIYRSDERWHNLKYEYAEVDGKINILEERKASLRDELIKEAGNNSCKGAGITVSKVTRKGNVDWEKIPGMENINKELYRKPKTESWRICYE